MKRGNQILVGGKPHTPHDGTKSMQVVIKKQVAPPPVQRSQMGPKPPQVAPSYPAASPFQTKN
jgi:hypothetical protein